MCNEGNKRKKGKKYKCDVRKNRGTLSTSNKQAETGKKGFSNPIKLPLVWESITKYK